MKECFKEIKNWIVSKMLKASAKLLIFAFLITITGPILAATDVIETTPTTNAIVYVLSGGLGVNILMVGIYVGRANKSQKVMEESNKILVATVTTLGLDAKSIETSVNSQGDRLNRVEDTQRKCAFFNRRPSEFVIKQ